MADKEIDILFVIVLYKCALNESETFLTLYDAFQRLESAVNVVVYDNSPAKSEEQQQFGNINITYVNDHQNSGVSKAYNIAATLAKDLNKKWLILLDQDTKFPDSCIEKYVEAIKCNPGEKLFAPLITSHSDSVISPGLFKFGKASGGRHCAPGVYPLKGRSLINCGLCIDVSSYWQAGGYNEKIQLDFSDHDFIKRLKKSGVDNFVLIDLVVKHNLSVYGKSSTENEKLRFAYYLQGINYMATGKSDFMVYSFHGLLRSAKLSWQHKNLYFVTQVVKNILNGRRSND